MAVKALILIAIILGLLLAGCADEQRATAAAAGGWDQLDTRYRNDCSPNGEQGVLHAWKGGRRYCFRYTIERVKPREGSVVVIAQADIGRPN